MVLELIDLEAFVTLTYARFDLERNRVDLVDCGHPRTLHYHAASGDMTAIEGYNVPLGFRVKETYREVSFPFEQGDLFFFYSDGITETRDKRGRFFGPDRLSRTVMNAAHLHPDQVIDQVKQAVLDFSHTRSFADDLTCVAVKIGDNHDKSPLARMELDIENRLHELERLRNFVRQVGTEKAFTPADEDTLWQMEIALNEAVSNIIKHAYEKDEPDRIRVTADIFPDEWVFHLYHRGKVFRRPEGPTPPPDLTVDHGFGLIIMDKCMDNIVYSESPEGINTIRLVKKRHLPERETTHGT
jgi:sigma-B regulation protein RsbU (phosphoserine phosphatase)